MKLNLYLRLFLVFLSFYLLINLFSCKTERELPNDNYSYVLENTTEDIKYFVKLDSIYGSRAEGKIYLIHNDLFMKGKQFELSISKNKCEIRFADSDVYTMKIKRQTKNRYEGYYKANNSNKKMDYVFYPYVDDGLQVFKTDRYKKKTFEVERIPDVKYADVKGYWSSIPDDTIDIGGLVKTGLFNSLKKKDLELDMDIYIPKDDTLSKRPLMMFVHGGAFFIGDKATIPYQKWCTHFASLGYVCVSINYRMGFRINSKAIERTGYQATQDAHAAMRYLISKRDIYRIDPDCVFVGGASAGSITAMNLAYMRNFNRPEASYSSLFYDDLGDLETSGNRIYARFKIKGVANMWGSMYDLEMLRNSNIPIISFHGDQDVVLPYGKGYPFKAIGEFQKVFFDEMYGSFYIDKKAKELGIRSELHTFYGQGHALHLDRDRELNDNFYMIQNEIVDFFYDELVPSPAYITQNENDVQLFSIDTTCVLNADWDVVGGIAIEESLGSVRALWFEDATEHELRVSGFYKNGAGFEDVFVITNIEKNEDNTYE